MKSYFSTSIYWLFTGLISLLLLAGCGEDSSGLPAQNPPSVTELSVQPNQLELAVGDTRQFRVLAKFSDGHVEDVTDEVKYSVNLFTFINLTSLGEVVAKAAGDTELTVKLRDLSKVVPISVLPPRLETLQLSPAVIQVAKSSQIQFNVQAFYSDGSNDDVTDEINWAAISPSFLTSLGDGLYQATTAGLETFSVEYMSVTSNATNVTITDATISSISVTPSDISIVSGTSEQLSALAIYSDGSTQDITDQATWNSANSSIASVSSDGLVNAQSTAGSTTITAEFNSVTSNTVNIEVSAATVAELQISPGSLTMANGTQANLTAIATFNNGSSQNVTSQVSWQSSATSVATVDTNGVVNALSQGTSLVFASFGGKTSNSTSVTVTEAEVLQVSVTPDSASIAKGTEQQFVAIAHLSDGSSQDVTNQASWQSSNVNTATIDSSGQAQAINVGDATITATFDGQKSSGSLLTITPALISQIQVTPVNASVPAGENQQFQVTAIYDDSSQQDVTAQASWSSSNPAFATVNASGLAQGIAEGSSTIQAKFEGKSASATLTITAAIFTNVEIAPSIVSLPSGRTEQFTATANFSDGSTQDVTTSVSWLSNDTSIATIDAFGTGLALDQGTTSIYAIYKSTLSNSATITVTAPVLDRTRVDATPSGIGLLVIGAVTDVDTYAYYSDDSVMKLNDNEVIYSIAGDSVLDVDATGSVSLADISANLDVLYQSQINATYNGLESENFIDIDCVAQAILIIGLSTICHVEAVDK